MTETFARLAVLLDEARSVQWSAPQGGAAGSGTDHSDMTADVALDPRRLALRTEILETERFLRTVSVRAGARVACLEEALDRWAGTR